MLAQVSDAPHALRCNMVGCGEPQPQKGQWWLASVDEYDPNNRCEDEEYWAFIHDVHPDEKTVDVFVLSDEDIDLDEGIPYNRRSSMSVHV